MYPLTRSTSRFRFFGASGPSFALDFVNGTNALDPRVTFTRASTATFFDSAGVLTSAAVDAPRFDYDPSTLAAQGLLIEESRTNSLWYSEEFGNIAGWGTAGTAPTITTNSTTSPSGTLTADTITFAAADSRIQNEALLSFTAGLSYTITLYAKSVGTSLNKIRLALFDGTQQNTSDFTVSNTAWTRLTVTFVAANTTAVGRMQIRNATDNLANSLYIWGAQLEAGAFPTSYIPTTTTALTRAADVASVNTLSPWYNATEGTVSAEGLFIDVGAGTAGVVSSGAAARYAYRSSSGVLRAFDGTTITTTANSTSVNSVFKVATGYTQNTSLSICLNAGTVATAGTLAAAFTSGTSLVLGNVAASNPMNGYLRRVVFYPRRLSNAELQAITT
jgi:hypothetical protein